MSFIFTLSMAVCCCGSIIAYKALIGQQFGVGFSCAVRLTQVLADFQLLSRPYTY